MPARGKRPAVYNTPTIRNGGFGVLQIEAIHNRPLSIARRHLAASELRMRGIEPTELSSSEWVRFLVMEPLERERYINQFLRRRNSDASTSSVENDRETAMDKAEEARMEAEEAAGEERRALEGQSAVNLPIPPTAGTSSTGRTPSVSIWARQFDGETEGGEYSARRPRHARRAVTDGIIEAPPTYETAVRSRTPPPAYEPRGGGERRGRLVAPQEEDDDV